MAPQANQGTKKQTAAMPHLPHIYIENHKLIQVQY